MRILRHLGLLLLIVFIYAPAAHAQGTPGAGRFPPDLDTLDSLYRASNNFETTLSAQLSAGATSMTVVSTTGLSQSGSVSVGSGSGLERIIYTGISGLQLTGLVRGQFGTTAMTHASGTAVRATVLADHHNQLARQLIATQAKIGFGSDTANPGEFLVGVTTAGQTEFRALAAADIPTGIDAAKIGGGAVSSAEYAFLDGVSSAIQAQFSNKQPLDATLTALAALSTAADKGLYATGPDTFSTFDLTSFARSVLDDANAGAFRTTLGVGTGDSPTFTGLNVTGTATIPSFSGNTTFDSQGEQNLRIMNSNVPEDANQIRGLEFRIGNGSQQAPGYADLGAITGDGTRIQIVNFFRAGPSIFTTFSGSLKLANGTSLSGVRTDSGGVKMMEIDGSNNMLLGPRYAGSTAMSLTFYVDHTTADFNWQTYSGTQYMKLVGSTGNLLIGTTTDATTFKLQVQGDSKTTGRMQADNVFVSGNGGVVVAAGAALNGYKNAQFGYAANADAALVAAHYLLPTTTAGSAADAGLRRSAANFAMPTDGTSAGGGGFDFKEISTPANPAADHGRLYAKDVSGATEPFWRRSDGTEVQLGSGGGGGGANTALSNLVSVAINTTLVSDTDNTDDLGTSSIRWKNLYLSGFIGDGSGNELMKFSAAASAVNEFTVLNAATGGSVEMQATGGDTDIGMKFTPKGIGAFFVNGGQKPKIRRVSSDTTLTCADYIVAFTSTASPRAATLPSAGSCPDSVFHIVDESDAAGTNNITVQRAGSDTFVDGGTTSKTISTNGGVLSVYATNANKWKVF